MVQVVTRVGLVWRVSSINSFLDRWVEFLYVFSSFVWLFFFFWWKVLLAFKFPLKCNVARELCVYCLC
jgi:hypothetical protein